MGGLLYVTGPARSGKSRWAVNRAAEWGPEVVFVATCKRGDDPEMNERIRLHREQRPPWRTLEAPSGVAAALNEIQPAPSGVVLDCLTLWMSDRLELADDEVLAAWDRELRALRTASWPAVVVGNEVGWAPVPDSPLLRRFRDLAGWLGQRTAAAADEAWLLVAGCPLRLK
ncbi:MAG TPA: bifunctional adenosylcobinamide kinase/adenosylcobinamide-phosphate guanylyltransferase [Myxococcales bacterium]